ncbi:flagellar brake protein [Paenibacillus aquistagni]|uniref:flagellar brake protein n=1 Tax=Paenibacillus aquistagni TaxID=1852522 RepID=UPI00145BB114|nr:PilZ domain-containing protein [Paenibacillus aquistagni]NMM54103.1 glycosyl transferase [Paenibacillus aquistagni]
MLPKINDMLFITPDSAAPGDGVYKARVTEVDDKRIWFELPIQEGTARSSKFSHERLEIEYVQEEGMKHSFFAKVVGSKQDGIVMLAVPKPKAEELRKLQRRAYLRVKADLELKVHQDDEPTLEVRTIDISGGGLSFTAQQRWGMKSNQALTCTLYLPQKPAGNDYISFRGRIVRTELRTEVTELIMVEFEAIMDGDREKIIRYCFDKQIEDRKRLKG